MLPGSDILPRKSCVFVRHFALLKRAFTSEPSTATAIRKIPLLTRTLILSLAFLLMGGLLKTEEAYAAEDLQQVHYRWRNDDGGELGLDTGTGADGAITPAGTFNLNTSTSGGRTYADGIAYRIIAPADAASSVTRFNAGDTLSNGIAAGDEVLLINMQGASGDSGDVGNYEFLEVLSVTASTITFIGSITKSYDGTTASNQKVVVQRVPNYTSVTLDSTDSITASAWDGLTTTPAGAAGYLTGIVVDIRAVRAVLVVWTIVAPRMAATTAKVMMAR